MTGPSADHQAQAPRRPTRPVRFVTAASLFEGPDATLDLMRRPLQEIGAQVIPLGDNRSVGEVVAAALQEDVQGIVIGSGPGGRIAYFKYLVDALESLGGAPVQVFGAGAATFAPGEIRALESHGVKPVFDASTALAGAVSGMAMQRDRNPWIHARPALDALAGHGAAAWRSLAHLITALESRRADAALVEALHAAARQRRAPVIGLIGGRGAGKSSLADELIRRLRLDQHDALRIAVVAVDPSQDKSGDVPLGHRIRMNAIDAWPRAAGRPEGDPGLRVFMRSLAAREPGNDIHRALPDVVAACQVAGFDLIVIETSDVAPGGTAMLPLVDVPVCVTTPEFVAASPPQQSGMLDFAAFVAVNQFDRPGAAAALHDAARHVQRNRRGFGKQPDETPVFGTMANCFNDDGVTALYQALAMRLTQLGLPLALGRLPKVPTHFSTRQPVVPAARARYLADIAAAVRGYKTHVREQAALAREIQQLRATAAMLQTEKPERHRAKEAVEDLAAQREARLDAHAKQLLATWPGMQRVHAGGSYAVTTRGESGAALTHRSPPGTRLRKVALPACRCDGDILEWLMLENVPGGFPYSAGTLAFEREEESSPRKHLSTAFDPVTLYGSDPGPQPDVYGKMGYAGVGIATLDDMKALYAGFDLTHPDTRVSIAIDGPAPAIVAMFINAAIDQNLDKFKADNGREPTEPQAQEIRAWTLANVRGTVQAAVPKQHPGRNACIFPTGFSLRLSADMAEYFVRRGVRHFQAVSIGGCPSAEAQASPSSQLAGALANGFTVVEACLARGLHVDDFASSLSFSFSFGGDADDALLGRVARRVWAVAMRDRYGANERSCKLDCPVQPAHPDLGRQGRLAKDDDPPQGLFVTDDLTERVERIEEGVLAEFERIGEGGGLPGATVTGPARGKSREESIEPAHSTDEDKQSQLQRLADFHARHARQAPAMLRRLEQAAIDDRNVFEVLMDAVRVCSLGQTTHALFAAGAQYRRSV